MVIEKRRKTPNGDISRKNYWLNDFVRGNGKFNLEEIGHVVLSGGTCFIPYVKERIECDLGIEPDTDLPLSQLAVTGAACVAEAMVYQ